MAQTATIGTPRAEVLPLHQPARMNGAKIAAQPNRAGFEQSIEAATASSPPPTKLHYVPASDRLGFRALLFRDRVECRLRAICCTG